MLVSYDDETENEHDMSNCSTCVLLESNRFMRQKVWYGIIA
jgi:hypothetical protein